MRLATQFSHSTLEALLPVRPTTTAPVIAQDVNVFLAPPATLSRTPLADISSISMLFSDSSSDSISGMDIDDPTGLTYPPGDEPLANTNEAPTNDNILTLIDCLQRFVNPQDPSTTSEVASYLHQGLSSGQSAMLSALGLELAMPSPEQAALLALDSAGSVMPSAPSQAVPVSFQVRLSDLALCSGKAFDPNPSPDGSHNRDCSLGTLPTILYWFFLTVSVVHRNVHS